MYQLKQCPHCGADAKLDDCRTIWRVECTKCDALFLGGRAPEPESEKHCESIDWDYFKQTAIDGWNNRPRDRMIRHAEIVEGGVCADCGYPAIRTTTNNNHPMSYQGWDYWQYCTNKGCQHHTGEGYAQCNPEWFVEVKND